jgi:hypothetical protein
MLQTLILIILHPLLTIRFPDLDSKLSSPSEVYCTEYHNGVTSSILDS